jgi:hypothetical protein
LRARVILGPPRGRATPADEVSNTGPHRHFVCNLLTAAGPCWRRARQAAMAA